MMPRLRSQKGQAVTEAILILVMMMGFTLLVARFLKNEEVLKKLVQSPFQHLAGLLQNGVWAPPPTSSLIHPNSHDRHITVQGESAR